MKIIKDHSSLIENFYRKSIFVKTFVFLIALKDKTINDSKFLSRLLNSWKDSRKETPRQTAYILMYSIANIAKRQDRKIIVSSLSVGI